MTSIGLYKKNKKIILPILNFFPNKLLEDESKNKIESNNNKELKTTTKIVNRILSNKSSMTNPYLYQKKNINNKISSIPISSFRNMNQNYNIHNKNIKNDCKTNNSNINNIRSNIINDNLNNNRKNIIIKILKRVNDINKKLRKNNSVQTMYIYQINEKNRKKLNGKYYRYNYCFNNLIYKKHKNVKTKNKIKKTSSMKITQTMSSDKNAKKLNLNKTQPNFSRKKLINKNTIIRSISLISNENKDIDDKIDNENNTNLKKIYNLKCYNKILSKNISYLNNELIKEDNERLIKSNGRFNKNNIII